MNNLYNGPSYKVPHKKKHPKDVICNCKGCGDPFNKNEIKRTHGKESMVYLLNFCSSQCYTKYILKKENDLTGEIEGEMKNG